MERLFWLYRYFILAILLAAVLSSCRTARVVAPVKLKPMSTGKIIKKVEENAFIYKNLSIKRINCQYESGDNKTSFRANLKTVKDSAVIVSLSKLNIPVGKVLLTPDSVKYVNHIDKTYFIDDYTYLNEVLNVGIDFETVQAILSNSIFSFADNPNEKDFKDYTSFTEDGKYVVKSVKERKLHKISEKSNPKKAGRLLRRLENNSPVVQTVYIEPEKFNLTQVKIEGLSGEKSVNLEFGDYMAVGNNDYPETINAGFVSEKGAIGLKIKLGGFTTEPIDEMGFSIPEKYKRLDIN